MFYKKQKQKKPQKNFQNDFIIFHGCSTMNMEAWCMLMTWSYSFSTRVLVAKILSKT